MSEPNVLVFWDELSSFTPGQYARIVPGLAHRGANKTMQIEIVNIEVSYLREAGPTPKEIYNAVRKPVPPWDKRYKQKGKVKR